MRFKASSSGCTLLAVFCAASPAMDRSRTVASLTDIMLAVDTGKREGGLTEFAELSVGDNKRAERS